MSFLTNKSINTKMLNKNLMKIVTFDKSKYCIRSLSLRQHDSVYSVFSELERKRSSTNNSVPFSWVPFIRNVFYLFVMYHEDAKA